MKKNPTPNKKTEEPQEKIDFAAWDRMLTGSLADQGLMGDDPYGFVNEYEFKRLYESDFDVDADLFGHRRPRKSADEQ